MKLQKYECECSQNHVYEEACSDGTLVQLEDVQELVAKVRDATSENVDQRIMELVEAVFDE